MSAVNEKLFVSVFLLKLKLEKKQKGMQTDIQRQNKFALSLPVCLIFALPVKEQSMLLKTNRLFEQLLFDEHEL